VAAALWLGITTVMLCPCAFSRDARCQLALRLDQVLTPSRASGCAVLLSTAVGAALVVLVACLSNMQPDALSFIVIGLAPLNLVGPCHTAYRIGRRAPCYAGDVLWGWLGLVWTVLIWTWDPHGRVENLTMLADMLRLSGAVACLLASWGRKPESRGPVWGHKIGWILLELDVILCAWAAMKT